MCSLVYGVQTCALPIPEGLRGHPGSWNRHMRRFPGSGAAGWRGRAMLAVGKTGGHHMRRCTGLLAGIFLLFIAGLRSEEHTSELHPSMRSSFTAFSLKKKKTLNIS